MTMLKGNTAAGKSHWPNTEERPLDKKTLGMGEEGVREWMLLISLFAQTKVTYYI